jgi:hypothetical protein
MLAEAAERQSNALALARRPEAKREDAELAERLGKALEIKSTGKTVSGAFELRAPPAAQARDLASVAALWQASVKTTRAEAKTAEAKDRLLEISRRISYWWLADDPPRALTTTKKLFSLPAVPKVAPRGETYQSSPLEWASWRKIGFSMNTPQYFQYEVRAAKDGQSAEIIAHGDLNGDGKQSTFKVALHVSPTGRGVIADDLVEQDPEE